MPGYFGIECRAVKAQQRITANEEQLTKNSWV